MDSSDRLVSRQDMSSRWFRRRLLIEMAETIAMHDALPSRDLNRRRLRAYAEGLLRAWNLHSLAHRRRSRLSLAAVARLPLARSRSSRNGPISGAARALPSGRDKAASEQS